MKSTCDLLKRKPSIENSGDNYGVEAASNSGLIVVNQGMGYDNTLEDSIGITLIATGFENKDPFVKPVLKREEAEEGKIAIRNIRKDINNKFRKLEKDGEITEDELKLSEDKVQKLTDKYIASVDEELLKKEK